MEIKEAKFIKTVMGDDYGSLPQIAFFGRSNVGKSSVINSIIGKKDLAKISKIPGKTRSANLYLINNEFYLIDFPGYGFAKVSIKERNKMISRILWYIRSAKKKPRAVFLVIDIKVGLTQLDKEMIENLSENRHKIFLIANKSDKLKRLSYQEQIESIEKEAKDIPIIGYSAKTKKGRDELLEVIERQLKNPCD